jgi:hypothetical protein
VLGFALAALVIGSAGARPAQTGAAARKLDVLLAFDTTGSMEPSIAAAKRDARSILNAVGAFVPDSHFAVASFRDQFYPGGEYTLVSPMTSSRTALTKAIGTLHSVDSTGSEDTFAEAYNLMFRQSYTDRHIGWRPSARKIVVVIGDAEPHSAGADGIAGCTDKTRDLNGLDTAHELARMRAAQRTLVFIRQASTATVSLQCYESLAALAYEGGSAVDGGGAGVAAPIVGLVKQSYAPLAVAAQLNDAVSGKTDGLTIRISNPNGAALTVASLKVELPKGLVAVPKSSSGSLPAPTADSTGLLTWQIDRPIAPFRILVGHLRVRVERAVSATIAGSLTAAVPGTGTVTTHAAAIVRSVTTARRASVSVSGARGTTYVVNGSFSAPLRSGASTGRLVVRHGKRVVSLQIGSVRGSLLGDPTRLVGAVRVAASSGLPSCRRGVSGTLDVLDSDAITPAGRTYDRVTVRLPGKCGGTTSLRDLAGGGLTVKVAFR